MNEEDGESGPRPHEQSGGRVPVSLACSECKARNYKTTKIPGHLVELKKYCKMCKKHTLHRETK
jgi:large subunit ribosomal protein L33